MKWLLLSEINITSNDMGELHKENEFWGLPVNSHNDLFIIVAARLKVETHLFNVEYLKLDKVLLVHEIIGELCLPASPAASSVRAAVACQALMLVFIGNLIVPKSDVCPGLLTLNYWVQHLMMFKTTEKSTVCASALLTAAVVRMTHLWTKLQRLVFQ